MEVCDNVVIRTSTSWIHNHNEMRNAEDREAYVVRFEIKSIHVRNFVCDKVLQVLNDKQNYKISSQLFVVSENLFMFCSSRPAADKSEIFIGKEA